MKTNSLPKVLVALFATCIISYGFVSCKESETGFLPNNVSNTQAKQDNVSKERTSASEVRYIEDETVKGDFELRNGTLHFKNAEIYFKTLEKFGKMKPEERLTASKAMKLKSLLEIQQDFVAESEKIDTKDKQQQLLKKYDDILKIEENKVGFNNIDAVSAALINRKGIVYLGKSLHCHKGLEQIDIENGDESLLNTNSELVKKSQYLIPLNNSKNNRLLFTCPFTDASMTNGDYVQRNCLNCFQGGGNRAITLRVFAKVYNIGNNTITVTPYALGTPLKKVLGSWYVYNSYNGLGCYWNYNATSSSTGQNLSSVASYSYTNTFSAIDYDGDTMTFSNTSSVNNIISQAFNFTYNGNTNYSSGGVSQPIIAGCF